MKFEVCFFVCLEELSPSLRRVWVEIKVICIQQSYVYVTLLAEGVG